MPSQSWSLQVNTDPEPILAFSIILAPIHWDIIEDIHQELCVNATQHVNTFPLLYDNTLQNGCTLPPTTTPQYILVAFTNICTKD